jgi:SPP1 gp7 family putative phage head morphogenesis protein
MLTKKEINSIIEAIRSGLINLDLLPREIYLDIFEQLEKSLARGMNLPTIRETAPRRMLNTYLQLSGNLRRFAAAKTYQMINSISKQKSVLEMKNKFNLYAKTWQQVENDLVLKQSMTVNDWYLYDDQKDVMPYLRYVTAQDERVRHAHAALHGTIKKVESSFWDEFMPPLGYLCRCTVEQLDIAKESVITPQELSVHRKEIDLQFRNNPAKSGFIFKESGKDKHSYFKIPEEYKKTVYDLI